MYNIEVGSVVQSLKTISTEDGSDMIRVGSFYTIKQIVESSDPIVVYYELEEVPGNEYFASDHFISADELNYPAVHKLEQLKKYFESGNEIPVDRAIIKASEFWKIYNGS